MSTHTDAHGRSLARLASGELSPDTQEGRELLSCPICGADAREAVDLSVRLFRMDRERDAILDEARFAAPDPARSARALRAVDEARRRTQAERLRRRLGRLLVAIAATVVVSLAYFAGRGGDGAPSDGRGVILGDGALVVTARDIEGGDVVFSAGRAARPGCVLVFVVLDSAGGSDVDEIVAQGASCRVPQERIARWPQHLEICAEERDASNDAVRTSRPLAWSPPR